MTKNPKRFNYKDADRGADVAMEIVMSSPLVVPFVIPPAGPCASPAGDGGVTFCTPQKVTKKGAKGG